MVRKVMVTVDDENVRRREIAAVDGDDGAFINDHYDCWLPTETRSY